ncbi:MAG: DUF1559 domain-containing protein [Verrucomicrobiae bacterium]|nr:DUF1559 domain-containing protein [Verrucomicrobiae bacterium]
MTLTELLVVLTVISALCALLLPALAAAREKGRQISCLCNLKQFGLAYQAYANDNDGWLLVGGDAAVGTPTQWYEALYPYLEKKSKVYGCPSDAGWKDGYKGTHSYSYYKISYGYNYCYLGFNVGTTVATQQNLASISEPSRTIFIADKETGGPGLILPASSGYRPVSLRHSGGGNLLLLDGHVAWCLYEQIDSTYRWDP